jgi:hypothetical protein
LSPGKKSDRGKVFQVLVIGNDVYGSSGAFEIVSPYSEGFEDGQEFLVVGVVVQFRDSEGPGVESHRVDLSILRNGGKNCGNSVIRCIGFNDKRSVGVESGKDWSGCECFFERIEGFTAFVIEVPRSGFAS